MAYSTVAELKPILNISADDDTHDTELTACIASADALVDGLLKKCGLTVPDSVPQLVTDASTHFAAWLFKDRRRDQGDASGLWDQAHKFLDAYVVSEEEIAFVVGSSDD